MQLLLSFFFILDFIVFFFFLLTQGDLALICGSIVNLSMILPSHLSYRLYSSILWISGDASGENGWDIAFDRSFFSFHGSRIFFSAFLLVLVGEVRAVIPFPFFSSPGEN